VGRRQCRARRRPASGAHAVDQLVDDDVRDEGHEEEIQLLDHVRAHEQLHELVDPDADVHDRGECLGDDDVRGTRAHHDIDLDAGAHHDIDVDPCPDDVGVDATLDPTLDAAVHPPDLAGRPGADDDAESDRADGHVHQQLPTGRRRGDPVAGLSPRLSLGPTTGLSFLVAS
jgi:hypothetical protein